MYYKLDVIVSLSAKNVNRTQTFMAINRHCEKDRKMDASEIETIDIEEYAKAGKPVPAGKRYRIKIDKQKYTVSVPSMTGRELLELAGKTPPEKFILRQKIGKDVTRIELDDSASFLAKGVERFMVVPKEVTEGDGPTPRRDFDLLDDDFEFLNSLGLGWESVVESGARRIVIHEWPIPEGYNMPTVKVNVRLESGYPDAQIDMAYFLPHLKRTDARPIGALSDDTFDGQTWQRWSRHRTGLSTWRVGVDNLQTHLILVENWLREELQK